MKRNVYPFSASVKKTVSFLFAFFLVITVTRAQSYTITFPNSPPPTNDPSVDQNDHINFPNVPEDAIETGVKFYVTQPGTVTGIRFYKGNLVTGTHIGHLWTIGGSQLAQATFSETANGWQEVAISQHIAANTPFVASVFSNVGDYAGENNGFSDLGFGINYGTPPIKVYTVSNAPGVGGNGVYKYLFNATNPTGAFPDQDGGATNFWIDIRFVPDFSLPVTLIDFKAVTATKDISLSWKTSSETNNKGFELQRSNNGADWYPVTFINGVGESTTIQNYSYTDKSLAPGLYYYRVKQVDRDGKSKNSSVVTASVSGKGQVLLYAANPITDAGTIRFDLPTAQKVRLSLIDVAGREVKVLVNKTGEAGSHQVSLNGAGLGRQLYYLRLQTENGIITKKIVVQ